MSYSAATIKWAREEADRPWATGEYSEALGHIEQLAQDRAAAPIEPGAKDSEIKARAEARAGLMADRIAALPQVVTLEWLSAQVEGLQGRAFEYESNGIALEAQLQGFVRRACCPLWWRRQLRRVAVRTWENQAQAAGRVSVRTSQPYVTNETVQRRAEQAARNRAMLEHTEIESQDGERLTLWAAVQASTANKAIRRGELMTRIRGAEEWATAAGMVGVFTTNTLPSRFHSQHFKGGANANYDGSTARDGQQWLCKTWARLRAKLKRVALPLMGYRVAEPHHDGCPHWHMLLWTRPERLQELQALMREAWLKDAGDEPGAQKYRIKFEAIDPAKGGAVGYVAKYIAKNIDDFGGVEAEGHRDEINGELFELDGDGGKASRVEAWAAAHGIRQFQAIGQPPVTVWRELRRVDASAAQSASSPAIRAAGVAVHRVDGRRACWRAYMDAQGGAMTGRHYRVKLRTERTEKEGRYGLTVAERPLGVYDVQHQGETLPSKRRQWRGVGEWTEAARQEAHRGDMGWMRDNYLGAWSLAPKPMAAQIEQVAQEVNPHAVYIVTANGFAVNPAHAEWEKGSRVNSQQQRPVKPPSADGGRVLAVHPWTRFNNCTRQGGAGFLMDTLKARNLSEPGGFEDQRSWKTPQPLSQQPPTLPADWSRLLTMPPASAA